LAYVWGQYQQDVIEHEREWYMLCVSYRWEHQKRTKVCSLIDFPESYAENFENDFHVVSKLWELVDEAEAKNNERIKLAEKLKKDEATLSDSEKEEILKRGQSLLQSIQLLSQQIQAKGQEVSQKNIADQTEAFQKIGDELIKAKKIKMLFRAEALLAFDRSDNTVNLTTEFIDLMNKEQKK